MGAPELQPHPDLDSSPTGANPRPTGALDWRSSWHSLGLAGALDVAVVAGAAMMLAYMATGGFVLGPLGVRRFSKPALLLVIFVALRAAVGGGSWLSRRLGLLRAAALRRWTALAARTRWATAARDATVAVLTVHVVAKLAAFGANLLFPSRRPFAMPFASARFAETFAAWDSGWYFDVAQRGYFFAGGGQSSVAFFPLYPLLMRALAWPFGGGERALWTAGVVLSCACLLLGLAVLHRLTETLTGDAETARRTVLYVAVFPFSYFFTQVYTESLFLLLTVAAVWGAVRGRWTWAGTLGGLAALTRPNGILILAPLGLLALAGRPRLPILARRLVPLLLTPAGLALFCLFTYRLSGDPLGWLHAQGTWGYTLGNQPSVELMRLLDGLDRFGPYGYFFSDRLGAYYFVHGMIALALIALTPSVFTRLGVPLGSYVALTVFVPLTGNALEGIGRYAATLFPVFMLLGTMRSRRLHEALLVTGALLLALFSALFVTWHPIY